MPDVLAALSDPETAVRVEVARALARTQPGSLDVIAALGRAANDVKDAAARVEMLKALGAYGEHAAVALPAVTKALKDPDKARELLQAVADRVDSSAPLIQLAGLEIEKDRLDAATAVVAKIRARWKEAAAADVLEAQIALKRGKIPAAVEHFNAALKKDPDNKIVRFWKVFSLTGWTTPETTTNSRWRYWRRCGTASRLC